MHKSSKSCLIRSAQPLVGSGTRRCKEDEAIVNAMLTQRHKKGWILDTRHANVVKSAQSKGEENNVCGRKSIGFVRLN